MKTNSTEVIMKILLFVWYILLWLVATFQWIPDFVQGLNQEDLLSSALIWGLSFTLLVPAYFIFKIGRG